MKKAIIWTTVIFVSIWTVLYAVFTLERLECTPVFSGPCLRTDWQAFGDFVLLHSVERWQTLLAGALAIAAALVGGSYINKQISHTERLEQQRLDRRRAALRAVMPMALGKLIEYCEGVALVLRQIYDHRQGGIIPAQMPMPEFPEIPDESISLFRDLIEVSDGYFSAPLARMLSKLQVQNSRIRFLRASGTGQNRDATLILTANIEEYILDAATVIAYGVAFFDYARESSDAAPKLIGWAEVRSALNGLGFLSTEYPHLHRMIDIRASQSFPP
ncbi:MAG: hypothetical protein KGR48_03960 [Alphaproteobacteria bacterium]|nr:hypothetical protein [Alphaproteobacteria bacterium]MBU6472181.1 hypothetical protein [Alphaproteobacteria bacterium]MDE2013993.1 hypothetical protein [Alphaproteobacteria bacterium]MDE2072610.1 hypothetical protein [Alphaproteobacteria bacterium]MDE2351883.1 hypothetical protein [Alphaproteobacteria bacterium]